MSGPELMAVVTFFVVLAGFAFGIWRYVEAKILAVRTDAATANAASLALAASARDELAAHRLHVAEHYVSKQGHRESTEQIMQAILSVKGAVDHLGGRIDQLYAGGSVRRVTTK